MSAPIRGITPHEISGSYRSLRGISLDAIRHGLVWFMFAISFIVIIEPAPCDLMLVACVLAFAPSGLNVNASHGPFILFLLLYLIGGFTSLIPVIEDRAAIQYVITSSYMAVIAFFIAFYLSIDSESRAARIVSGWTVGAAIGSLLAIAGALNIAGTGAILAEYGRATGLFKDPNVYSTYVIPPAILLIHAIATGRHRHRVLGPIMLMVMVMGVILSYSRGAFLNFALAGGLMYVITFILEKSQAVRLRILIYALLGLLALTVLIAALLSIGPVRDIILDRLTLTKDYDSGETGRFGAQLNSVPELLGLPLGYGPLQFRNHFPNDPHNVYLNSFASYGWLGGISYLLLVACTIYAGFKAMIERTPFQYLAICAFCVFVSTAVQAVQIDTNHWRHFYWLLGIIWGLYAASLPFRRNRLAAQAA